MRKQGVRFVPGYGRHATKVNGKFKFSTGSTLGAAGERGPDRYAVCCRQARRRRCILQGGSQKMLHDDDGVHGVEVRIDGKTTEIKSSSGGFSVEAFGANAEWRTRYLGFGWDLAKVRGRFNTGDGIRMALDIGAQSYGNWSAHAAGTDLNTPLYGEINAGDGYGKHRYPYGIMVNADGKRFLDEGADFHIFTYAKYGKIILAQPGQFAWQIFDSKVLDLLSRLYRVKQMTKVRAATLEALADKLEGVNKEQFLKTVAQFNAAVTRDVAFNPSTKDGRGTTGLRFRNPTGRRPSATDPSRPTL